MRVRFSTPAQGELDEAVAFYEQVRPGLGERFSAEVDRSATLLGRMPLLWPVVDGDVRRCLLTVFPYSIFYSIEQEHVYVIALIHQHRRPGYWRNRVKKP